jgi:hypothetical protein
MKYVVEVDSGVKILHINFHEYWLLSEVNTETQRLNSKLTKLVLILKIKKVE